MNGLRYEKEKKKKEKKIFEGSFSVLFAISTLSAELPSKLTV